MMNVLSDAFRGVAILQLSLLAIGLALSLPACTYYEGVPVSAPANKFDRAWDAARGAAADVGVVVTSADRSTGVIRGYQGANDVTISVWTQADGSVRIEMNAKSPTTGADAALVQSLSNAYDRRMGR